MQLHEIEYWALQIIERVQANQQIEDSRVELKSEWPDAVRAARRLAGHANAARGAPILWLIGVDEVEGVVGTARNDLAFWYPQVEAQFDGLAPQLTDLAVPFEGKTVVVLYFETHRRPFVVKNPAFGKKKGETVSLEVPWRRGTRTESASRDELVRLLSPLQKLPSFEALNGSLTCGVRMDQEGQEESWRLEVGMYTICPVGDQPIIVPFLHCTVEAELASASRDVYRRVPLTIEQFAPRQRHVPGQPSPLGPYFSGGRLESVTQMIACTPDEIMFYGPGLVRLTATAKATLSPLAIDFGDIALVEMMFRPLYAEQTVTVSVELELNQLEPGGPYTWNFSSSESPPQ